MSNDRSNTPSSLALDALKYALKIAEAEEWNLGEQHFKDGYAENKLPVGLIAVKKMRAAIDALSSASETTPMKDEVIERGIAAAYRHLDPASNGHPWKDHEDDMAKALLRLGQSSQPSATCPECATARAAANSWKDELTALRQRFSDACSEITRLSGQESATPARSTYPWGAQFKVPVATEAQKLADKIEAIQDDGGEGVPWSQDELDLMVSALRSTREAPLIAALDKIQAMEWPAGDAWAGARKATEMYAIADEATRDYYAASSPASAIETTIESPVARCERWLAYATRNPNETAAFVLGGLLQELKNSSSDSEAKDG